MLRFCLSAFFPRTGTIIPGMTSNIVIRKKTAAPGNGREGCPFDHRLRGILLRPVTIDRVGHGIIERVMHVVTNG